MCIYNTVELHLPLDLKGNGKQPVPLSILPLPEMGMPSCERAEVLGFSDS